MDKPTDTVRLVLGSILVAALGCTLAPTATIHTRERTLRGLIGRYAPASVIVVGGPVDDQLYGPDFWGHDSTYTMRTVDTHNNPYGTGDTYESFNNIVPKTYRPNGGQGSHWPNRQPAPYDFHDIVGIHLTATMDGDPLIATYDQIWHNTDKGQNDTLNTYHLKVYFRHTERN